MSFRQFPATDANGVPHVVLEFRDPGAPPIPTTERRPAEPLRYQLEDGRPLLRDGRSFRTADGSVQLTL
ncbi:hypothetical protein [Xanthomonas massiliensis]|jgi:hypothetical protein|uniref:hypothetical protein n=1 Tax=Xanthomonas massiliensis TaxID=1720302 RepID=UPI000824764B|nr:hypothetical protein [Xanthomonas massiliensis]